jgi:hypothetical protein
VPDERDTGKRIRSFKLLYTIRELIVQDFETRLEDILTGSPDSYFTDCGENVYRAQQTIDPDDCPASNIWPGPERAEHQYNYLKCTMEMRIETFMAIGSSNASTVIEKMLGDIKKCILSGWSRSPDYIDSISYTGGGAAQYPADGQKIAGAFATFNVVYTTKVDDPYSQ